MVRDVLLNSQNVNRNTIISTIVRILWCQLVLIYDIIVLKARLRDSKHQHLAGAFSYVFIFNVMITKRYLYAQKEMNY